MKSKGVKTYKHRFQFSLLSALALFSSVSNHALAAGAITPFTVLEAESGTLGGGATIRAFTPGSTVPSAPTMELEASGMAYVWLTNLNDSVLWTNPVANASAMVVRGVIPDAPGGGGITATINMYVDGVFRQAITLSSKQSWNYRNSSTTPDDPNGGGTPWHFYNEDRTFITGTPIAAGSVIMFRKEAGNIATYYNIDAIDLENVSPPKTQPPNSLCITNAPYNADPTFTIDSLTKIQNCINDARSQGKTVWIPPGKFMINSLAGVALDIKGVTVEGAGVWYSTIYKNVPLPPPAGWRSEINLNTNSVIRDVFVDSDGIYRGTASSGLMSAGSNWLVERVWVQHCDAQWMSGSFGTIRDSRVADSWADGINLNNGNTPNSSKLGISLTASNNFVRGSGDDNIATYSDSGASHANPEMQNTRIINNTCIATYWANGLRIAGGTNVTVQGNLIDSVAANSGLAVGVFGDTGHPLDSALVADNVVIRGGGWNGTGQYGMNVWSPAITSFFSGAYTKATISNNIIKLALRDGLRIVPYYQNLTVLNNIVDHPAQAGVHVQSGVIGTGVFQYNLVTNLNAGKVQYQNDSPTTFVTAHLSNSWTVVGPLIKSDTTTMNVAADWSGTAPASGNIGQFDNTISAANATNLTLGGNVTLDGLIFFNNMNGPVTIGSGNTLTLATSGGINMVVANSDVTMNCLLSATTFNITGGRTLALGGGSTAFLSGTSAGLGTLLLNASSAKSFTANGSPSVNMGNPTTGVGGLIVSNNCTMTDSGSFVVGNSGGGVVTLNSPTAAFNTTGGGVIMVGRNSGSATSGRLTLINGSINTAASTAAGIIVGYQLNTATAKGVLNVQGGTLTVPQMLNIGASMSAGSAVVTISGGTVTVGTNNFGGTTGGISTNGNGSLTLTGGALYIGSGGMNSVGTGTFTSTRTLSGGIVGGASNWSSALPMTLTNVNGNVTFQAADAGNNPKNITLSGPLAGIGGLIKSGGGTLALSGTNTYAGTTTINAGTLALIEPGSINNSAGINIASGATFDVIGRIDDTLTLRSGQTLLGNGSLNGKLITAAGSILTPGPSIGTLTVTNDIVLGGSLLLELNRTQAQTSDRLNTILGTITGGGTLLVTNIGPALQAGDTFQLFSSAVSGFTTVNLPGTNSFGNTYNWTNKLALNGSIQILTVVPANPLPGKIQFNVSGNTLSLSWPTNAGWLLQAQTNALNVGLSTNWVTVPGSDLMTGTNITINPTDGVVFYRLIFP
ncbi:MAG: hypothetical protein JWR19_2730 [Pedosphaera sp.]|nr:hypothetical protein [Pedosphaera sp.]